MYTIATNRGLLYDAVSRSLSTLSMRKSDFTPCYANPPIVLCLRIGVDVYLMWLVTRHFTYHHIPFLVV
jgi:hypothetical protein